MSRPDTLTWLAGHELRLGWRDWVSLMTAGHRNRARTVTIALILFAAFMHLFAYWIVAGYADASVASDTATLVGVTGTLVLSWSLLLSQAMESVTRAFYARSDLDLILTSPVSARKVFAVRMGRIAAGAVMIAVLLAAPFINVLALRGGSRWLAAYGVVAAMGAVATAAALALTIALFRLVGAKRTRLIAQIVAAVIGAAFVIGLQIAAIFSSGSISRFAALQSDWMLAHAPDTAAPSGGRRMPCSAICARSLPSCCSALPCSASRSRCSRAASAIMPWRRPASPAPSCASAAGRSRSAAARAARVLRQKEWTLLARDPWLISQTLMQILYLLPPAVLLWVTFRSGAGSYVVLIPVVVMAAGQLAGGLAWLSISGEDAPDLVASAPITAGPHPAGQDRSRHRHDRAGVRADRRRAGLRFAVRRSGRGARHPDGGGAATLIQICFRTQAKRSQFRRRQTSSRIATFAEAFSSIAWAATSALAAAGTWTALGPALIAIGILFGVRMISPPPSA